MPWLHPIDGAVEDGTARELVVFVGDPRRDGRRALSPRMCSDIEVIDWTALAERLQLGVPPKVVYSNIVSSNFDCLDIAQLLYRAGFKGRYRVIAEAVPNPQVIRRDLAETCPGLDFEVVSTSRPAAVRLC